ERAKGVAYFTRLKAEIDGHLAKGSISYRRTQELGYFASEALGHFDLRDESLRERAFLVIDRYLDGYRSPSLDEKIHDFETNSFRVFDHTSPARGLAMVAEPFEKAFFSKDQLELIGLPTLEPLGTDVFMRLSAYNLFLVGVA